MTTTNWYIEEAITELLNDPPDIPRAIGLLTVHRLRAVDPIRPSNEPVVGDLGEVPLPPMRPLSTKVSTLSVACPTCKAKPGKRCFRMTGRGPGSTPTDVPLLGSNGKPNNHKTRVKRAQQASS